MWPQPSMNNAKNNLFGYSKLNGQLGRIYRAGCVSRSNISNFLGIQFSSRVVNSLVALFVPFNFVRLVASRVDFVISNVANTCLRYFIFFGESVLKNFSRSQPFSNVSDFIFGKASAVVPTPIKTIDGISLCRARIKVRRIYALTIIAMVAAMYARVFPVLHNVRNAMRQIVSAVYANATVVYTRTKPFPTIAIRTKTESFINSSPKPCSSFPANIRDFFIHKTLITQGVRKGNSRWPL